MPRRRELAARYADALAALAEATHHPANVVNLDGRYAIRVDLAHNRFLLAANTAEGLSDDPDTSGAWLIRICQENAGAPLVLASACESWLIDAFDSALETLQHSSDWITSDAEFGEFAREEHRQRPTVEVVGSAPADTVSESE
ncbi:hypothetical protein [Prescottella equi]|uniref:Uncharacterized protein n=1 Tax=Rhodococcus hoagii (strain 103S) TaxID=685727 RepID=A0A3S5YDL6_RHOH1|nr:hypothetical protein [Prescottella equi]CBH50570.1 hypothetical protein REQ_46190 [Prescottella equi 103S]